MALMHRYNIATSKPGSFCFNCVPQVSINSSREPLLSQNKQPLAQSGCPVRASRMYYLNDSCFCRPLKCIGGKDSLGTAGGRSNGRSVKKVLVLVGRTAWNPCTKDSDWTTRTWGNEVLLLLVLSGFREFVCVYTCVCVCVCAKSKVVLYLFWFVSAKLIKRRENWWCL